MNVFTKVAGITLTAAGLFGLSGMASVAQAAEPSTSTTSSSGTAVVESAPGDPGDIHANAYHRGFDITNLSSHRLRIDSYSLRDAEDQLPAVGTIVAPGQGANFQIVWLWGQNHSVQAQFSVLDDQGGKLGSYYATMTVSSALAWTEQRSSASTTYGQTGGQTTAMTFLDPAGTVIDIPAGEGQRQAEVLNSFCGSASATCSFTPTSQERLYGPHHVIGKEVANNTPLTQKTIIEEGDEISLTHSVSVTASAKLALTKIVELSLSATYGHSWTTTHIFKQTEHLDIPAYHKGWLQGVEPIIRDTGDFTLTMANTTWKLHGVHFDTPDPTRGGLVEKMVAPLTPTQQDVLPQALAVLSDELTASSVIG